MNDRAGNVKCKYTCERQKASLAILYSVSSHIYNTYYLRVYKIKIYKVSKTHILLFMHYYIQTPLLTYNRFVYIAHLK